MDTYLEILRYDVDHLPKSIKDQLSLLHANIEQEDWHRIPLECYNIITYINGNSRMNNNDKKSFMLVCKYLINRILVEHNLSDNFVSGSILQLKGMDDELRLMLKEELYHYIVCTDDVHGANYYHIHFDNTDDYTLNLLLNSHNFKLYSTLIRYYYAKANEDNNIMDKLHFVLSSIVKQLCDYGVISKFIDYINYDNKTKFAGLEKLKVPVDVLLDSIPSQYDFMKLGVVV